MSDIKSKKKSSSLLSLPEIQGYLGIKSRKTILKYIKSGKLNAFKLGGTRWRISRADVDDFIEGQQNGNGQVES